MEANVCIIDDDEAIRESLRLLLFAGGMSSTAYESADAFLADEAPPGFDCMILDKQLAYPVIFITGHGDIPLAVRAIKQGAYDFLTKPFQQDEILIKVQSALDFYKASREELVLLQELRARVDACTPREQDVMRLLASGLPNKGIAETLGISPRTVEIHRAHVMEKMDADSLPALVRMVAMLEN